VARSRSKPPSAPEPGGRKRKERERERERVTRERKRKQERGSTTSQCIRYKLSGLFCNKVTRGYSTVKIGVRGYILPLRDSIATAEPKASPSLSPRDDVATRTFKGFTVMDTRTLGFTVIWMLRFETALRFTVYTRCHQNWEGRERRVSQRKPSTTKQGAGGGIVGTALAVSSAPALPRASSGRRG
jgi:hypothetical protein